MARVVSIGAQGFEELRTRNNFYVDKTAFIADWWQSDDSVTLITRPRRFGKTLMLDTVRCFFSTEFAERGEELFGGLAVWDDPEMRQLQGAVPVVSLSFSKVKTATVDETLILIKRILRIEVRNHKYLFDSPAVEESTRDFLASVADDMDTMTAIDAVPQLCQALEAHWGRKPIVLLDEYDTPMQAAWLGGFWDELSIFMRTFMDSSFKTNPALDRALMSGITRISRESIFSGLNNLEVCGVLDEKYQTAFGFTEQEVETSLKEFGLTDEFSNVQTWYDGFCFGGVAGIYNPWSISKYLERRKIDTYWMNTSDNALAADLVRRGSNSLKTDFELLIKGETISKTINEQVVFSDLDADSDAVWSLLVASGYLTLAKVHTTDSRSPKKLKITNKEVMLGFDDQINRWFGRVREDYNGFVSSILAANTEDATDYLNDITLASMSSFDGATKTAESEPERFYHGLVLGLLVSLRGRYTVESNRESGRGRCDVLLVPANNNHTDPAIIIEFKAFDARRESTLEDTAERALAQIEEKVYATTLVERGFLAEQILSYGIAFRGKEALVALA